MMHSHDDASVHKIVSNQIVGEIVESDVVLFSEIGVVDN